MWEATESPPCFTYCERAQFEKSIARTEWLAAKHTTSDDFLLAIDFLLAVKGQPSNLLALIEQAWLECQANYQEIQRGRRGSNPQPPDRQSGALTN